ncbi:MAG: helix-turn-helix domain-containing protein [Planctomycetes bacterium]|nr:helix-turn-helix domain-containing protein [Planctomycetota bacterium]
MIKLLLRPAECCEALGISRSRIYELIASGELPSVRIGRSVRVPVRALEKWVAEQSPNPTVQIPDNDDFQSPFN